MAKDQSKTESTPVAPAAPEAPADAGTPTSAPATSTKAPAAPKTAKPPAAPAAPAAPPTPPAPPKSKLSGGERAMVAATILGGMLSREHQPIDATRQIEIAVKFADQLGAELSK